jgi:hypothetical protein
MNDVPLTHPVRSRYEVADLSDHDRSVLAQWLVETTPCEEMERHARLRRRVGLMLTTGGAVLLVPWIVVLVTTLPDRHSAQQWRIAWTGFDVALTLAFGAAAWLGWHRRQLVTTALIVLGVLLLCDAWFDVTLSWGTSGQALSILSAAFVEVPAALLALVLAHSLLHGTVHYIWHLQGREHPVPPLYRIPLIFLR